MQPRQEAIAEQTNPIRQEQLAQGLAAKTQLEESLRSARVVVKNLYDSFFPEYTHKWMLAEHTTADEVIKALSELLRLSQEGKI